MSESVRVRSYRALVESILMYNYGAWGLTDAQTERLDRCQRRMIRRVLGVMLLDKISNEAFMHAMISFRLRGLVQAYPHAGGSWVTC